MKKAPVPLFLFFIVLYAINASALYKADWESLGKYPVPEWFKDAKFGIYTHWGIYSVPAYITEWYPHGMYMKEGFRNKDFWNYHRKHWGPQETFGYKDFIPLFTGENFNPDEWAELFEKAGAKFAGPCAVHHDGFLMWDSKLTEWDAADMGPKRDVVGELEKAIKKRGMKFVTTFHHARTWVYYPHIKGLDTGDPKYAYLGSMYGPIHEEGEKPSKEWLTDWENKVIEVIDKYDPDMIWFDGGWSKGYFEPYKKELIAHYFNKSVEDGDGVCVGYKRTSLPKNVGILDYERGRASDIEERPWLTDLSVYQNSWGYIKDVKYYTAGYLIDEIIDIVSKNGCVMLNVGPKPDGTIPEKAKEILLDMGEWFKINGEAIYGTRPWKKFGEGPTRIAGGQRVRRKQDFTARDIRFTTKRNAIYVILMEWPGESITINSLGKNFDIFKEEIKGLSMLGTDADIRYEQTLSGLTVFMPDKKPCKYTYVIKVEI